MSNKKGKLSNQSFKERTEKDANEEIFSQQLSDDERLSELRETAEAAARLAEDENVFKRTVEAFREKDAERFQTELSKIGLLSKCRFICRFLCSKHCGFICLKLCKKPQRKYEALPIEEIREFAQVIARISKDEVLLKRFVAAVDDENVEAFDALITRLKLEPFCHQLCQWLCSVRCRLVCTLLCPPTPLITEVGFIVTSQISSSGAGIGLGSGPSSTPGLTPPDNKPGGVGDHPFGGVAHIRGLFNITAPFQYKVEYATSPAGPWTPILQNIDDYGPPFTPFATHYPRLPDALGWYNISEMKLLGSDYLTDWNTPADRDKVYYLKLTVRNSGLAEFESPIVPVRIDNGQPSHPIIDLELQTPDGQRQKLGCCEKIERGKGNLLVITLTASDENFSSIGVSLMGGCGVSFPIIDTGGNPLSKTYNGNIADTGYPIPTSFLWDPWAAGIDPCCYLIYVTINDRTIINNSWSGGHGNVNWHAITIA